MSAPDVSGADEDDRVEEADGTLRRGRAARTASEVEADRAVLAVLPGAAITFVALFAVFAVLYPPLHPNLTGGAALLMTTLAVGSAGLLAPLAVVARIGRVPLSAAHAATAAAVLLGSANADVHLLVTGEPRHTSTTMLIVAATGAVLIRPRWLSGTLVVSWLGWAAAAFVVGSHAEWPHYAFGMGVATLLAATLNLCRRRGARELASSRAAAEDAAVRDQLTGLANRRGMAMLGTQIVESARRRGDAVHCIFVDVDGLEPVNDMLGPEVGDELLVAVADALRAVTRTTDAVARWGGDEFCIVGPGHGTTALDVERRVQARLTVDPPVDPAVWRPRVTAGAAMLAPWDDGTLETLLAKADTEVYARRTLRGAGRRRRAVAPD